VNQEDSEQNEVALVMSTDMLRRLTNCRLLLLLLE